MDDEIKSENLSLENWEKELNKKTTLQEQLKQENSIPVTTDQNLDSALTIMALKQEETVNNLVGKKGDEMNLNADAKIIEAELRKQRAEAQRAIDQLNNDISFRKNENERLKVESEKLNAEINRAESFYEANKEILKIIGVKKAHGYRTMCVLIVIAMIFYIPISAILFIPFSIVEYIIMFFIDIIGEISKRVATNGLKVLFGILSTALTGGMLFGIYWIIYNLILKK